MFIVFISTHLLKANINLNNIHLGSLKTDQKHLINQLFNLKCQNLCRIRKNSIKITQMGVKIMLDDISRSKMQAF